MEIPDESRNRPMCGRAPANDSPDPKHQVLMVVIATIK
jgi:hypothetical protein